jgi:hypothetical protein
MRALVFFFTLCTSAAAEPAGPSGVTVAVDAVSGAPVRAGELYAAGSATARLVDRSNMKIELAPHSVVDFDSNGEMLLMRGSAYLESRAERGLRTSSARVDFAGRILLSYDHKDKSSSVFVLEGDARMVNPHQADRSLRLERFRGATLEVGGILPQLVRQLSLSSLQEWMQGYAWPLDRRNEILGALPDRIAAAATPAPAHLKEARLEDYFSSIETADEFGQPDYYQRKFADPDAVVAEANSKKESGATLSPEEAALISLPSTRIDLGFEILGAEEKRREVAALPARPKQERQANRLPASVKATPKAPQQPASQVDGLDPEVNEILERLRGIRPKPPIISRVPEPAPVRGPASGGAGFVPDPVYDYSENF